MYFPFLLSLWIATLATFATLCVGLPLAYFMTFIQWKGKSLLKGVLLLPLVLPATVTGYGLLWALNPDYLMGRTLNALGLQLSFHWSGGVLTAFIVSLPLMVFSLLATFEQIPQDLLDAADVFGKSKKERLLKVILPLSWRGLWMGLILSFARGLGEFGATLMLIGNIPNKTQTMPLAIYQSLMSGDDTQALYWVLLLSVFSLAGVIGVSFLEGRHHKYR